jgi:hypothetical protein
MAQYGVHVFYPESDQRFFDGWIHGPTLKKAQEKAEARVKPNYASGYVVELELASHQREMTRFPELTDLSPTKHYRFAKKIKRTNAPKTCLWCGKKLVRKHAEGYGGYADNAFCSMRCGYEFGITAACLDFRLAPREDKDA